MIRLLRKARFQHIIGGRFCITLPTVLRCAVICVIAGLLTSCGFIGDLFEGGRGLGENFQYQLTINYSYNGGNVISVVRPIFFWVMPLDKNGDVMQDPENPEGPPLSEELISVTPSGSVSVVVSKGDYGVLAFVDESGTGDFWIGNSYALYKNRSLADITFDPIDMSADRAISFQFDDSYEFHHIFITSPKEGETVEVPGSSMKLTGGLLNTGIVGDIDITVNGIPTLPAYLSPSGDSWDANISVASLNIPGSNFITADAFFQSDQGPYTDSFTVYFYCR